MVICCLKFTVEDKRNSAVLTKRGSEAQTAPEEEVMSRVFKYFEKMSLHSCIENVLNFRKKSEQISHGAEQAEDPPLRYVTVMTQVCIVFPLLVLSKC